MEEIIKQEKEIKLHTRICPYCKQKYDTKIGFKNWKNLFRMPTTEDWISLIILILILLAAYAYNADTKTCRNTLENLESICISKIQSATVSNESSNKNFPMNISNLSNQLPDEN